MASETLDTSSFENALHLADRLITSIKDWIPLRTQTIHELRNIARELNNIAGTVNTSKVIGRLAAVGGGGMVLGSLFAIAFPFSLPLLIAGTATSLIAEGATLGSDFVGGHFSGKKMKKAQKVMDNEKKVLEKIEQIYKELEKEVDEIGIVTNLGKEHVLSAILIANQCGHAHFFGSYGDMVMFFRCAAKIEISKALPVIFILWTKFGKMMTIATVKRTVKVAATILGRIATGAVLVWDMYELISTVVNMHQGCISSAASDLFEIADKYEAQMNKSLAVLTEIEELTEDFESQVREMFRERLVQISRNGDATDDDLRLLHICTSATWYDEFRRIYQYPNEYLPLLGRVFDCLRSKIEEYVLIQTDSNVNTNIDLNVNSILDSDVDPNTDSDSDSDSGSKRIRTTVIAHGSICSPKVSGAFYYPNDNLASITLYEPWGCAIDASVVHGIVTDKLRHNFVHCFGQLYKKEFGIFREVGMSSWCTWNILPKDHSIFPNIPMIELAPAMRQESAVRDLERIFSFMSIGSKGLVIPYFAGFSDEMLPFPQIPLWVLCHAVGLVCKELDVYCDMHIACCLSTYDSNIIDQSNQIVDVGQYYTVAAKDPPVCMTNLDVPESLRNFLAPLTKIL